MQIKKYKDIQKFAVGGVHYTPFIPTIEKENKTKSEKAEAAKEGNEKITGTITKEIISILKQNGLPNDVDTFLKQANTFLDKSKSLSTSLFGDSSSNSYDMSDLIQLQSLANKAKHNKDLFDDATKQLGKERSWSEVAVNDRGNMYVYSEEGLETVDPSKYYEDKEKYKVLTNSELLSLRQSRPELSYNQDILTNITNSVGMESIVNYTKQVIHDFGTNSGEAYVGKNKGVVQKGLENLMSGPDGIYKLGESHQGYDPNDQQSVEIALSYLYQNLPSNMKHGLSAKAAAEGLDPNDPNEKVKLLKYALLQHTNHKQTVDFDSSASTAANPKVSGKADEVEVSHGETIAYGRGVDTRFASLSVPGSNTEMKVFVQQYGTPQDKNRNLIPQSNLKYVLDNADFGGYVDRNSIFIGDQKISDLNTVVWDGKGGTNRVMLPVDLEYFQNTGNYKPDLNIQKRFDEFQKQISEYPGRTDLENLTKAKDMGLPVELSMDKEGRVMKNDNGESMYILDPQLCKSFLSLTGFTSSLYNEIDTDSQWLHKQNNPKDYEKQFNRYANFADGREISSNKSALNYDATATLTFGEGMYSGNIYMAIPDPILSSISGNNEYTDKDNYRDMQNKALAKKTRNNIKTNFDK